MARDNETVAEVAKQMRRNEEVFHHLYWCEYADRIEAAHGREVAELRECLKEAVGEMCEYCKYQYSCDKSNCTNRTASKWRKALEGAKDENR